MCAFFGSCYPPTSYAYQATLSAYITVFDISVSLNICVFYSFLTFMAYMVPTTTGHEMF